MPMSIALHPSGSTDPSTSEQNPPESAPRQDSSDWRTTQLPRLEGLPLVPTGAGVKGKAPVNPRTGKPMSGWESAAWTPDRIAQTNPGVVTAVGTRCGPDADGLVIFDLDGEEALGMAAAAGCEVFTGETWSIFRRTAADRLKVVWRVAAEQWADLTLRSVTQTNADGECRVIWATGQAVVAGWHKTSESFLEWSGGPEAVAPLPPPWLALWRSLKHGDGGKGTTTRKQSSKGEWRGSGRRHPCPICSRTRDADCQIHVGGHAVLCHHGVNDAPPSGLRMGEVIAGGWAFCGERQNAIGRCSLFRQHQPRERPPLRVLPDPPRIVPDRPGSSAAAVLDDPGQSEPALEDLFTPGLAGALRDRCRYLPADPAAIAVAFLAAAAGAVKNATRVIGAEAAGYAVPANHYGAVVAPSGAKKTPLGTLLIQDPTAGIRADLRRLQEQEQRAWQEQQQEQQGKQKRRHPPDPPRPRMFTASEMTGEALALQLATQEQHGLGFLIHRDEIAGLIAGLNQYRQGRGADHQQLLEAFDGRGGAALRVKSDGLRSFERCQLAIYGGIQPGVLRGLVAKGDDSGLWARFLFAPLPARVVPLPPDDPEQTAISTAAAAALKEAIETLYRLPPHEYRLTPDAGDRFRRFEQEQQQRVHAAEVDAVSALAGKGAGKVLRVAGLLHLLAIATGEAAPGSDVTLERIGGAIALVTWCHDWTAGIHEAAAAGDDLDPAALVMQLARVRAVSWKDLYHRLSHRQRQVLGGAAGFAAVARQLEADGRGAISTGPRGGLRFKAG